MGCSGDEAALDTALDAMLADFDDAGDADFVRLRGEMWSGDAEWILWRRLLRLPFLGVPFVLVPPPVSVHRRLHDQVNGSIADVHTAHAPTRKPTAARMSCVRKTNGFL